MAANPFASRANGCVARSTRTRLARPGSTSYGRLELQDADGGGAWTNPLWT